MMLTITLSAPIAFLEATKVYLMAITASGDLTVWLVSCCISSLIESFLITTQEHQSPKGCVSTHEHHAFIRST